MVYPFEETATTADQLAGRAGARVVHGVDVEAIGGDLADRVDPLAQQAPEALRTLRAGETAADPDQRDRLARHRCLVALFRHRPLPLALAHPRPS